MSRIIKYFAAKTNILLVVSLLAIVTVSFWPSLFNELINLDDSCHLSENPSILNGEGLSSIFQKDVNRTYIPLTTLSFALEYHFFGLDPFIYHLDNLLLHLAVTVLIFFLGLRLGLGRWGAWAAALLFGIHPMHVESVAWATERKDVLYSVFYLLALHAYWSYLQKESRKFYFMSLAAGLLSILAKPMALSLPLILCLMDWFHGRKWSKSVLVDKIPFLIYTIPIAGITYALNARMPITDIARAPLVWIWSFSFYLQKWILPRNLHSLYLLPDPVSFTNIVYLISIVVFIGALACLWIGRKIRWMVLAFGFYFLSIFFLLRFDMFDMSIVADRFMYLPSLGFCFLFGYVLERIFHRAGKNRALKTLLIVCLAGLFAVLSFKTSYQCRMWKDSLTVYTRTIHYNSRSWLAFANRGLTYADAGKFDLALDDYNRSIELNPYYAPAWINRGALALEQMRSDDALADLSRGIQLDPNAFEAYNNRSLAYEDKGRYDLALLDVNQALSLRPNDVTTLSSRGQIYAFLQMHDEAIKDYSWALQIDPSVAALYYFRSKSEGFLNHFNEALMDALKAQEMGYPGLEPYIEQLRQHVPSF